MTKPTTLAEMLAEYTADMPRSGSTARGQLLTANRAYMNGAMAALLLMKQGATLDQLRVECLGFGRAIGSAAEAAT